MKAVSAALSFMLALAVASSAMLGRAQGSPKKQDSTPELSRPASARNQFDRYFPFRVGEARTYIAHGESAVGSGQSFRLEPIQGSYSETVLSVRSIPPAIRIIKVRIVGTGPDHTPCTSDSDERQKSAWTLWYVVHDHRVFMECAGGDVVALTRFLRRCTSGQPPEDNPEYAFPFEVGDSWGADPASPERADSFYKWVVEDKTTVTVPAGTFNDCYRFVYRTLPDHLERWVCSGVGLVAEEYTHHGWVDHYRIELAKVRARDSKRK